MNILVIDVGTSSMRGILFRADGKKLKQHQVAYRPSYNTKGELEQSADEFVNVLATIVKSIQAETGQEMETIDAIAITAQRSSVVPLDKNGEPLMPVMMWQDARHQELCQSLEAYNDQIANISGAKVNTVFSGGKMAWIRRERPQIYCRTAKLVNIPEYLIYRMTGNYITDYTYGSRSNLMNLKTCSWDKELLGIFGVKEEHLCELREPGSMCGYISREFAAQTGVRQGIPVITSGGDQQCAAIGQGAFKEGVLSIVAGTGAFLVATCDHIPEQMEHQLICNCSAVPGKYIVEASVLACCSALDWFLRNFYDWEDGEIDYARINRELKEAYGNPSSCLSLPFFQGRSTPMWNPKAAAAVTGITLGTTRPEVLKSILEGIFFEIKNNIRLLGQYTDITQAYISGGLTNSRVINQMQADIYGILLQRMKDTEATARGALMAALYKMGVYESMEQAFRKICSQDNREQYTPDKAKYIDYMDKQQRMNLLYEKIYESEEV